MNHVDATPKEFDTNEFIDCIGVTSSDNSRTSGTATMGTSIARRPTRPSTSRAMEVVGDYPKISGRICHNE